MRLIWDREGLSWDPPDMEKNPGCPRSAVEGSGVGGAAGPRVLQGHSCPPGSSYLESWVSSDCRLTEEP